MCEGEPEALQTDVFSPGGERGHKAVTVAQGESRLSDMSEAVVNTSSDGGTPL